MEKNYKMIIAYDGSRYYGWEHQPNVDTIQGRLEKAFYDVLGCDVIINGAGRTDAGVHALGMVANVWLDTKDTTLELRKKINDKLPDDIAVKEIKHAADKFHARYSAVGKIYKYTIHCGDVHTVFDRKYVNEYEGFLDVDKMKMAAKYFAGEHDFAAFCKLSEGYKSTVREIYEVNVLEVGGYITIIAHGSGFMRNMVRIIAGTLIEVGCGKIKPEEIPAIIESKDRERAGHTALAKGLTLVKVEY